MKKVLFIGMLFGGLALTSCKKDYTCSYNDSLFEDEVYTDLDKDQAKAAESVCVLFGGTWSKN